MTSATFIDLRINNAEQFVESLAETSPNTKIYFTFGKADAWPNTSLPNTPNTCVATVYEVWDNMIGGKRLVGGDCRHVIPRNNWTANTVYTAYDHMNDQILSNSNTNFFVLTSAYGVYKCLSNNMSSNSTVEPTAVSPYSDTNTSDGYVWKFMYTVSDSELIRFTTTGYIPVRTLAVDDGSQQWLVQDNATEGAIHVVALSNVGTGYTNTSNVVISISGDGSLANAIATINTVSNTVNTISVIEKGSGYTYATVTITGGGGSGAAARAIISPPGGHGSNPLYELGGKSVVVNPRLLYDEGAVLPVTNDFGQIALIKDPFVRDSSNVSTSSAFLQCYSITLVSAGSFTQDEFVYQGASLAASTFSGRVLSWDTVTGKLLLINTLGTLSASDVLKSSTTSGTIASATEGELEKYSGRMMYVDNIKAITRASDQIEDFKIIVNF